MLAIAMLATTSLSTSALTSRRALLLAPLAVVPLAAQAANPVRDGMAAFANNRVEDAIELYDSVIRTNSASKPFLWQRGLALYYAERFADGADQFSADVAVNPNDTEEQIWHLLCLAQVMGGLEAARPLKLTVGTDRRPVMRAAQQLFLSGSPADESRLSELAQRGDASARFYALLYLSLYYESLVQPAKAEQRMLEAVQTEYARGGGRSDPMVELARVAIIRRNWGGGRGAAAAQQAT
jgi:tetratricopeptide (TPR) repeat protein